MKVKEDLSVAIVQYLKHPVQKVLLIAAESKVDFNQAIFEYAKHEVESSCFFDLSEAVDVETILSSVLIDIKHIFVFANASVENYYIKYRLDRFQAKVILICDASCLHPTLDASIYFAPVKNNRIQRNLFSQVSLTSDHLKINKAIKSLSTPKNPSVGKPLSEHHYLNQKLMTQDPVFMHMLADRVLQSDAFKAFLFEMIFASRDRKEMQIAAANAITIFNFAKIALSGLDLSKIKIAGAVLDNAILDHTNLSYADLTNVRFQKAFMRGTDLSRAILANVRFGEYLSLKQKKLSGNFVLHPNGEDIISGCNEPVMRWSLHDGKLLDIFHQHMGEIEQIAISNNGHWLAAGDKNQVIVWHYESKKILWKTDVEALASIAFSADNARLLILSYTNEDYVFDEMLVVNVWNIETAQLEGAIKDEINIRSMVVGCDDQLITCSYGGYLKCWNLKTRNLLQAFKETYSQIYTMRISEDGKLLAINYEGLLGKGLRIMDAFADYHQ